MPENTAAIKSKQARKSMYSNDSRDFRMFQILPSLPGNTRYQGRMRTARVVQMFRLTKHSY